MPTSLPSHQSSSNGNRELKQVTTVKEVAGIHDLGTTIICYTMRCGSGFGNKLGATLVSKCLDDPNAHDLLVGHPMDLAWAAVSKKSIEDKLHLMQGYAAMNSREGQRFRDAKEKCTLSEPTKVISMDRTVVTGRLE